MINPVTEIINRFIRYFIVGMVFKAITWLFRKVAGRLLSIIVMALVLWFAWFMYYHYREYIMIKINDFLTSWANLTQKNN